MKLLKEYDHAKQNDWSAVDDFLSKLDSHDCDKQSRVLDKVLEVRDEIKVNEQDKGSKIVELESQLSQLISSLSNGGFHQIERQECNGKPPFSFPIYECLLTVTP